MTANAELALTYCSLCVIYFGCFLTWWNYIFDFVCLCLSGLF